MFFNFLCQYHFYLFFFSFFFPQNLFFVFTKHHFLIPPTPILLFLTIFFPENHFAPTSDTTCYFSILVEFLLELEFLYFTLFFLYLREVYQ